VIFVRLRKLEEKDATGMLEWMQDPDINGRMHFKKGGISLEKTKEFIGKAQNTEENLHLAITDDKDEYLGTVSLKNIDQESSNAEFAIAIRTCAMGRGVSKYALKAILEISFYELNLHKVYLYVRSDNTRAIKFYEKCNLKREGVLREHDYDGTIYRDLIWYGILKDEFDAWKGTM